MAEDRGITQPTEQIQNSVNDSMLRFLERTYPYLDEIARNQLTYLGIATPEAVKQYIPEAQGELFPHYSDFGIGARGGTLGAQKDGAILYSLGGRLNLPDLAAHEVGHRAAELNPEWYKTFNAWQYPKGLDDELTLSGYLTSSGYDQMQKDLEGTDDTEPPLSLSDLIKLDQNAKEEFFLRRAQHSTKMGSGPTDYLEDVEEEPNFLSDYVESLTAQDKQVIDYIVNRYLEFLKYGPSQK